MKRIVHISISFLLINISCQKELSFTTSGVSEGTLKIDGIGDCLPATINGIYKVDTVLNNTNYIDVQVNVTVIGTYGIKSDTVNGYSFKGSGTLGVGGVNTVRLYGSGKPIVSGLNVFTIRYGSSICTIDINVIGTGTNVSVFTLGGTPGTCSGVIVNGTYTAGVALSASNSVTLTVNVTIPGTYALGAASVNGMLFANTGVFTGIGVQTVTLNGLGTPQNAGIFNVVATNIVSTCTFSITVLPAGAGTAVFTLSGAPGACNGAVLAGTYSAGTILTSANTVTLNVNVTTIGTYSITTNSVNGYSFSKSGSFTLTGNQTVVLAATGTPLAGGANNFTPTAGSSTCTFSVTVTATPPPTNLDYIPETFLSNWTYALVGGTAADTFYTRVNPNTILGPSPNAVVYKIFEGLDNGTPTDTVLHRKNGGFYYQLFNQSYGFDNNFNVDGLLLDSNRATNNPWPIVLGGNTIGGQPATLNITAVILQKGATATIAGNNYTNIIKVKYTYAFNIGSGETPYAAEEIWYAKGKGLVRYEFKDIPLTITVIYEATRVQIF